jgi:hypothetical protein
MTREELQARWAAQREVFNRTGALVDASKIINQFLIDLADVEQSEADTILTLKQAATRSGYTVDHLARMIRQGRIPNAGRHHAPRVRLGDLPVRRQFARNRPGSYDVMTDAQALRNGRQ